MKKMKRLVALALSVVMVLAMSVFAFADEPEPATYSITINNAASGHTYQAYQIFAGDLSVNDKGEKILSNITWGNGINEDGEKIFGDAAAKAATLNDSNASEFAKEVASYLQSPTGSIPGSGQYTISGLTAGYYLVKDKEDILNGRDDFYTSYILRVVSDVNTNPKGNKPSLNKQIQHNDNGSWGVVGDNQIGDTVNFRTITTVPDTTGYTEYSYVINDTMSAGLISNVNGVEDVTIKVNDNGDALSQDYYTVTADGNKFSITVNIIKAIADEKMNAGDSLYSYYTGVLNKDALIYDEGKQDNTAYLEYSNNPNDTEDKGRTPDKKVYDWTFKMGVNKVDNEESSLNGAKFVLSKNGNLGELSESNIAEKADDLISLITNDGKYTVAPANTQETTTKVIEAGSTTIEGLDDNTDYYLYEIKAPIHYNKLKAPVKFKIAAEYNDAGDGLRENYPIVTIGTGDPSTTLKADVINESGSNLPSTGGIGTTIFYVVGGILMVGAAVLLITKRRAEN